MSSFWCDIGGTDSASGVCTRPSLSVDVDLGCAGGGVMHRRTYLATIGAAFSATVLLDATGEATTPRDERPLAAATRRGGQQLDAPPTSVSETPESPAPLRVGIYVTTALARTARDTGYASAVRPSVAVANQLGASTDLLVARLVHDPVELTERDDHRKNNAAWRATGLRGDDDAALLLTTTRDGEWDGYGGEGYAVAEAEDLIYYQGDPWTAARRNAPFAHTLAVALHEIGHAVGLTHDDHRAVEMPAGDRYVTLMGVGAPGVDYDGFFLQFSRRASQQLSGAGT